MEKVDLTSPAYWETPGVDIRLNPRLEFETAGLGEFVASESGLDAAVVFATSGSTGSGPRFVILEKRAILASAAAVNRHLEVTKNDRWLCALTTFHVGGLGVWARAWKAGCPGFEIDAENWDRSGATFVRACRDKEITLTALTPTHLHDVIKNQCAAPDSLRAVLVGGGALDDSLLKDAVRLGWPILRTYGMTEAASQIATDGLFLADESERGEGLPVLPEWEARTGTDQRLELRGPALFRGYAIRAAASGAWTLEEPFSEDGFYAANDRVRLDGSAAGTLNLRFVGRVDDQVKKLGEMVSLTTLRQTLRNCLPGSASTILAQPHERMGNELLAVIEDANGETLFSGLEKYNARVAPFERIDRVFLIEKMPRTGIGKVAHGKIVELLKSGHFKAMKEPPFSS